MNEVNKTLFIPLYGKARVSKKGIILKDQMAEKIWEKEGFPIKGKSKSKWLAYSMAMRAKVFDEWTEKMLGENPEALVLHIGCGLDSRCLRVSAPYSLWIDGDFPDVIEVRKSYYSESSKYRMQAFDLSKPQMVENLPQAKTLIVILEGISMYLKNEEINNFFKAVEKKYERVHILMDAYTVFGAKASKYKNPINDVGVTKVWGVDDIQTLLSGTKLFCKAEPSMTPDKMIALLPSSDRWIFKKLFAGSFARKIYRLYELESVAQSNE